MITFTLLMTITLLVLGVIFVALSIGGAFFITIAADLIVALGILWIIYKVATYKKKK